MSGAWVLAQEVKRNAHAGHTPDEGRRWMQWIHRAEQAGRARQHGPGTLAGHDWAIDCDTWAEAEWLRDWLISACGFTATMVQIRKGRHDGSPASPYPKAANVG